MSDRKRNRTYWLLVLASTLLTVGALFGLQEWYRTYMLVTGGGLGPEVGTEYDALERSQREKLASGQMPIDRAMRLIVERGRTGSALVSPESSVDPGPASGWLHHPDYEPPPQVPAPGEEEIPLGGDEEDGPPVVPTRPGTTGTLNPQPGGAAPAPQAPPAQPAGAGRPAPEPAGAGQPAPEAEAAE